MVYLQMGEYSGENWDRMVYLQMGEYSGVKLGPDGLPSDGRIFRCETGTRWFTFRWENIQV